MHTTKIFKKGKPQAFRMPADLAHERLETYGRMRNHRDTLWAPPVLRQA